MPNLNENPTDSGWAYEGDTTGLSNDFVGSCEGGEGAQMVAFTAPQAGSYIIQAKANGFAPLSPPVLYVRELCGVDTTELACDEGDFFSGSNLGLTLEAGQLIFIFVDGQANPNFGVQGQFRLTVAEHVAPTVSSAQAWFNQSTGATAVELSGIQGPVTVGGVEFQYLNGAGQVNSANGEMGPFRVGADAPTVAQPDGRLVYSIETTFNRDPHRSRASSISGDPGRRLR